MVARNQLVLVGFRTCCAAAAGRVLCPIEVLGTLLYTRNPWACRARSLESIHLSNAQDAVWTWV